MNNGRKTGSLCRLTRYAQWVLGAALLHYALLGYAQSNGRMSWVFSDSIPVSTLKRAKVFYHLESSGRKNIAASKNAVAVVWEDNRSGTAAIYFAIKAFEKEKFAPAIHISSGNEAIEPSIIGITDNQFLVAWGQDGEVWSRLITAGKAGAPKLITNGPAGQVSVASGGAGQAYAVWSQRDRAGRHIRLVRLSVADNGLTLKLDPIKEIDHSNKDRKLQFYPSVAIGTVGVVVTWEDRRAGHTQIFYSCAGENDTFTRPLLMNEQNPKISSQYGSGTGAARVSLSKVAAGDVVAVWSDKRDFRSGYDVYSSFTRGSTCRFGPNTKVQDEFGAAIAQWHPSAASDLAELVLSVWQDDRNEGADIWLSWVQADGTWSDDLGVPQASGGGEQTHPAVTIDHRGVVHVVWIDRADQSSPAQLRYIEARGKL